MNNIADSGLLSSELENVRLLVRTRHAAEIEVIESINRRAVAIQYELQVAPKLGLTRIVESLYARTLFYIQSSVLLIDRGLDAPARVLLCAALEALLKLGAVATNPNAAVSHLDDNTSEKVNSSREFANVADPTIGAKAVTTATFEWKARTKAVCNALQEKNVDVAQSARAAGLEDLYCTAYPMLSHPVHSTIRGLERCNENDGRPLVGEPTTERLGWLYLIAGKLLVEAIQITAASHFVSFVPADVEQFSEEARAQLKMLANQIEQ